VRETGRFAKYASLAAALACFTVFALAAVGLHQERADHFGVEEQGPIPAALSHVLYGAPGELRSQSNKRRAPGMPVRTS